MNLKKNNEVHGQIIYNKHYSIPSKNKNFNFDFMPTLSDCQLTSRKGIKWR